MISCLLKKALPFTLTFIVGATVGGLFKSHRSYEAAWSVNVTPLMGHEGQFGDRHGCRAYRRRLLAESSPLVINSQPTATYTTMAKRHGLTGVVRLRVTFGADGSVKEVVPLRLLPDGLTESAEAAAWQIKFTPATENGVPISVAKTLEFDFPSEQTEDESALPAVAPSSDSGPSSFSYR
jgi:TonB family protein